MTLTRADIIKRGVLRMGGHAGSISSGTATAAVLGGLIDFSGDDSAFWGWHLFMLDAATEADRERIVTAWDDSIGAASFLARSDVIYSSEGFILSPDYSLDEYRQALNKALRDTKRTYRYVMPLIPGVSTYDLSSLSWLEGADDIDKILVSLSPNMLHNEEFDYWQAGSALAPDGWTLSGSGASVARSSSSIFSSYAATVTRASADATLYQDTPLSLVQFLVRSSSAPLPIVSAGAWVTTTTADIARIGIYNGSATTYSSYVTTTSGVPTWLSTTYQTTATDTALRLVGSVDTSAGSATFHRMILTQLSDLPGQLQDYGSKSYSETEPYSVVRNIGGWPKVELSQDYGYGQLVIYARRPFTELTADTDVVPDQYADALVSGMLRWLTDAEKPNQDRTRLDRIRGEEAAKWARANKKFIDKPVQPPPTQVRVGGA